MDQGFFETTYGEELYALPTPVTVMLAQSWESVGDAERVLLQKILNSVNQTLNSVQVIQNDSFATADLPAGSRVISFGAKAVPEVKPYEVAKIDGITIVLADSLNGLDEVKKKNLWIALKAGFLA